MQIKAKDDDLKGVYSNMLLVRHAKEEFCLDFVSNFGSPVLASRVLTSPGHMKRIIKALGENVRKYEERFGEIEVAPGPEPNKELGFQSNK